MAEKENRNIVKNDEPRGSETGKITRRDIVKGLTTVPVLGAFAYAFYRKRKYDRQIKRSILENISLPESQPLDDMKSVKGKKVRLGLIGFGIRGPQIASAAGFMHPDQVEGLKDAALKNNNDTRYEEFLKQEDLNIEITAVCDIFSVYAKMSAGNRCQYKEAGRRLKAR